MAVEGAVGGTGRTVRECRGGADNPSQFIGLTKPCRCFANGIYLA